MNKDFLISTVVPFWNQENFLREAIESVFAQTYDNWQLLLVDDGSTDLSTSIALWYAEHWPHKVRYLKHSRRRNLGASATRNLGITHAEGAYIAFLDADDVRLPHKLEQQLAIFKLYPEVGVVYGATQWWYSWTGKPTDLESDYVPELGVKPDTIISPPTLLTLMLKNSIAVPCTCSMVVRRQLAQSVGGFEESIRRVYTDQAFYAKLFLRASAYVSGECWDRYRQHANSSCSLAKRTGERESARLYYLQWLKTYLSAQGITNLQLLQALKLKQDRHSRPVLHRLLRRVLSKVHRKLTRASCKS